MEIGAPGKSVIGAHEDMSISEMNISDFPPQCLLSGFRRSRFSQGSKMYALSSESADLSYSSSSPVLLAASSASAMRRAEATVDARGLRIGARLPVEDALARLTTQASATAVWLELDRDCGGQMDELVSQVSHDVSRGSYAAVISVTPPLVDAVAARVEDDAVELLVDADEAERAAALALAIARHGSAPALSDVARDGSTERLRQLSEEVGRIASTLARLSSGPANARPIVESASSAELPAVPAETVRAIIRARRLRARYFPEELFADPAWDMLLDLLQAEIAQLRVPVSSLCIAAAVPATTALRWLKSLVSQGLFIRRPDPHDGRRVYVELAHDTSRALRRYFAEVGQLAVV
jgi:DNA-binding MarR family transcriptional regulator